MPKRSNREICAPTICAHQPGDNRRVAAGRCNFGKTNSREKTNGVSAGRKPPPNPTAAGLGIPNSLFGRNNSLFREQQGIACKPLKLLNDSPPLREQGIPCRRLKLLDELTPTSAERTGNFANSLLFSLLSGNLEPEVGSCRRQGNADDGNARPLHHRTTGPRPGEA